jgi:hypothetical protein
MMIFMVRKMMRTMFLVGELMAHLKRIITISVTLILEGLLRDNEVRFAH